MNDIQQAPSSRGWSASLAVDVALGVDRGTICSVYDLQDHELQAILDDPRFVIQLSAIEKELEKEGMTFRLKAQMQAEALLNTSWDLVQSPHTPPAVRAGLIRDTVRWAGFDDPAKTAASASASPGGAFSVNIVFAPPAQSSSTSSTPSTPSPLVIDQ